jgi:hypothetical protein
VAILSDNPRGVLAEFDELAAHFGSFDKYRKGSSSDSATWLSFYNAHHVTVDRKGTGSTYVPAPHVSKFGNVQPGVLPHCFTEQQRESGMMARFLMAYPNRIRRRWSEHELSRDIDSQMANLFSSLYLLEPQVDASGNRTSYSFQLSQDARQLWKQFFDRHDDDKAEHTGSVNSAFSKLEEHPLRFALIFHCVKQVTGATHEGLVHADTMSSSIALTEWFKNETLRIHALVSFDEKQTDTEKLIQFIKGKGGSIKPRDLQRSNKKRYPTAAIAESVLSQLADSGLGTWNETKGPGRTSKQFTLTTS